MKNNPPDRRSGHSLIKVGGIVIVAWFCCSITGLWRYVPPLSDVIVNHLDEVKGGQVKLIVSASENPGGALLSPDGRWMLVGRSDREPLLLDLVNDTSHQVNLDLDHWRWLENDLFAAEKSGHYFLVSMPDMEVTELPIYPKEEMDGVCEVELLRQADQVYGVETFPFSGHLFIAIDEEFQYAIIPYNFTLDEEKALLKELPQAVVILAWPYMTKVETDLYGMSIEDRRYYSRDGSLYARAENPSPVDRTPYLEVRTTVGDKLLARVRKGNYAPAELGWSTDGRGFYFQMITDGVGGVLTPESPIYLLELPDSLFTPTSTSTNSLVSGLEAPFPISYYQGAAQA